MNAFRIWPKIFPHKKTDIEAVESLMKPHNPALQKFRSGVAFHSNRSIEYQLGARAGIMNQAFIEAIDPFLALAQELLEEEQAIKGLSDALASMEKPPTASSLRGTPSP